MNQRDGKSAFNGLSLVWARVCASLRALLLVCLGLFALPSWSANYSAGPGLNNSTLSQCTVAGVTNIPVNVTETTPVIDLDFGIVWQGAERRRLLINIQAPSQGGAARVSQSIVVGTPDVNPNPLSNYNIVIDDEASLAINGAGHGNNSVTAARYQNRVQPQNALDVFDGFNPNGTWNIRLCDRQTFAGGNPPAGAVDYVELRFQEPAPDLELDLTASSSGVLAGGNVTFTATLSNTGQLGASGVTANLVLPSGMVYQSHSGGGTYTPSSGAWTLGTVAAGGSVTLSVVAQVNVGGTVTGELLTASGNDPDSVPGNGQNAEDDSDNVFVAVTTAPGNPPNLTCTLGSGTPSVLDWTTGGGAYNWPSPAPSQLVAGGTISQTYSVPGATKNVTMTISLSGSIDNLISRTLSGSSQQTPVTHPQMTGGSTAGNTDGVIINVDYDSTADLVTMKVDLGVPGIGMEKVQFPVYDVDIGAWTDRIVARGFLNGSPVAPIYTTSSSNTIANGGVVGTGGSTNTQAAGNMWVTFQSPVDVVEFDYDNVATQADPASQVISLENIVFCEMPEADVSAQKAVAATSAGGQLIPGEDVTYTITVTNSASATAPANDIELTDTLPDNLLFLSASASSDFAAGGFANPPLPATNTDCTGGACVISFEGGSLGINATGTISINARVK